MILSYLEKLGNYSPFIAIILYIIYYFLSNSIISLILISIGIFIGIYVNNLMNDNIYYLNNIFKSFY